MSGATLPDLLEALGEVFLVPGAPGPDWAVFARAPWATSALRDGLPGPGPWEALDVAYAGLFLAGRPTLHLEDSAFRSGLLQDEAVLGSLEGLYAAAGLHPDPSLPPDSLGVLLCLEAHLLRRAGEPGPEAQARELLHRHLAPLGRHVAAALRDAHPFYAAAGRTLEASLDLCLTLLG